MTPHNIKQLKRLNQVIFPVSYNDKFYKDVLEVGELAKLGMTRSFSVQRWSWCELKGCSSLCVMGISATCPLLPGKLILIMGSFVPYHNLQATLPLASQVFFSAADRCVVAPPPILQSSFQLPFGQP